MAEILEFKNSSIEEESAQELDEAIIQDEPYSKCRELSCFANKDGYCNALNNTDFGMRQCPFYKEKEDAVTEQLDALQHLIEAGRYDLIEKYRGVLEELGILEYEDSFFDEHAGAIGYLESLRNVEKQLKQEAEEITFADLPDPTLTEEWDDDWDEDDIYGDDDDEEDSDV